MSECSDQLLLCYATVLADLVEIDFFVDTLLLLATFADLFCNLHVRGK